MHLSGLGPGDRIGITVTQCPQFLFPRAGPGGYHGQCHQKPRTDHKPRSNLPCSALCKGYPSGNPWAGLNPDWNGSKEPVSCPTTILITTFSPKGVFFIGSSSLRNLGVLHHCFLSRQGPSCNAVFFMHWAQPVRPPLLDLMSQEGQGSRGHVIGYIAVSTLPTSADCIS